MAGPVAPEPGQIPTGGPPRWRSSLWARVEAGGPDELAAALAHLEPWVAAPGLRRALVQVVWAPPPAAEPSAPVPPAPTAEPPPAAEPFAPPLWAPRAAELVRRLAARYSDRVSTWIPVCHPGAAGDPAVRAFATPPHCPACPFYRGRLCQGLGHEAAPFAGLTDAPPALRPVAGDPHAFTAADFGGPQPVCYWRPERRHVAAIGAAVRAAGGTLWDLGAGNGFLAALLAQDEGLAVTAIDRLDVYPAPAGVRRLVGDVRAAAAAAAAAADPAASAPGRPGEAAPDPAPALPAAVLVSWPPGGDAFADVVRRLRPGVVIYARDAEAFCGRSGRHAGVVARPDGLTWFGWPADDFRGLPGRRRRFVWRVFTHQDAVAGRPRPTGRLEIRAPWPLPAPASVAPAPYPWER